MTKSGRRTATLECKISVQQDRGGIQKHHASVDQERADQPADTPTPSCPPGEEEWLRSQQGANRSIPWPEIEVLEIGEEHDQDGLGVRHVPACYPPVGSHRAHDRRRYTRTPLTSTHNLIRPKTNIRLWFDARLGTRDPLKM